MLPAVPATAAVPLRVERIGGANRVATAVGVAKAWASDQCAVLAENGQLPEDRTEAECRNESPIPLRLSRADSFADALSAASLATGQPVLLTYPDRLPSEVTELGDRLQGASIFGSVDVVGREVENEIFERGYASQEESNRVTRYAGPDRYATSVVTAEVNARRYSDGSDLVPAIVLATGENWPDGLAASALARQGTPIVLTGRDEIPPVVADFISQYGSTSNTNFVLIGGRAAISEAVEDQLGELSEGPVVRLAGADRSGTARAVADRYLSFTSGPFDETSENGIILVRPDSFADAIGASALVHSREAPIVIPSSPTELGQANIDWLIENGARIDSVTTLGDTGVVPETIVRQALDAICRTRNCDSEEPESVEVTAELQLLDRDGDPLDPDAVPYAASITDPGTVVEDRHAFHDIGFATGEGDGDIDLKFDRPALAATIRSGEGQLAVSGEACVPRYEGGSIGFSCGEDAEMLRVFEIGGGALRLVIDTDDYRVGPTPILPGAYRFDTLVSWSPAGQDEFSDPAILRVTYTAER